MEAEERARPDLDGDDARPTPTDGSGGTVAEADVDGRAAKAHERCIHHPTRTAVARCDACHEPICLSCAVPVRGRVVGPECLPSELGDPALTQPPELDLPGTGGTLAVAGALAALVGTAGPWTRTGAGDRLLGAWVLTLRWSLVAAVAAAGLLAVAWWLRGRGRRPAARLALVLGAFVTTASLLAIVFPPTFQAASWGSWVSAGGGAIAGVAALTNLFAARRPTQGV